jgi:hypothetical protein
MSKSIYVLTWCNQPESFYGTTLIFKTLRVGFPNANIQIVDNASQPIFRTLLKQYTQECDAEFTQLESSISHHNFIEQTLNRQSEGTAIFVDPDVCFWENVEEWNFDALVAGRLLPKYRCEYSGCLTNPRLHTSFMWIPDVIALREAIQTLRTQYFEFNPFHPVMFRLDNTWQRFDTGASLYAALSERMYAFAEKELEAYDHLFCGTHLDSVASKIRPDYALLFERMHKHVQVDHRALKGAWRIQEDYFNSLIVPKVKQESYQELL